MTNEQKLRDALDIALSTDSPIIKALKSPTDCVVLRNGARRLTWLRGSWVVLERLPHQRQSRTLIETSDEAEAVKVLLADEDSAT